MRSKSNSFFKKKGVSPLIATVLLISFAVALGAVVLNWGRNLDSPLSGDICSGASIKIRNINNIQVCYAGAGKNGYINFIIENDGNKNVDGLEILIDGEKGTKLLDYNDFSIKVGELLDIKDQSLEYDFDTFGPIKSILFFPKVQKDDSLDICGGNFVKVDKLGVC